MAISDLSMGFRLLKKSIPLVVKTESKIVAAP